MPTAYANVANDGVASQFVAAAAAANGNDQFYVGASKVPASSNGMPEGADSMFDEDGLNAIAAAATAAADTSGSNTTHPSAMDISSVTWPTPTQAAHSTGGNGSAGAPWNTNNHTPWTSFMFNPIPANTPLQQQQQAQAADETLQMLLRFLDG